MKHVGAQLNRRPTRPGRRRLPFFSNRWSGMQQRQQPWHRKHSPTKGWVDGPPRNYFTAPPFLPTPARRGCCSGPPEPHRLKAPPWGSTEMRFPIAETHFAMVLTKPTTNGAQGVPGHRRGSGAGVVLFQSVNTAERDQTWPRGPIFHSLISQPQAVGVVFPPPNSRGAFPSAPLPQQWPACHAVNKTNKTKPTPSPCPSPVGRIWPDNQHGNGPH